MARILNGKLLDGREHFGDEILRDNAPGRRAVLVSGGVVRPVVRHEKYSSEDIRKMKTIPDRTKGSYYGQRSNYSKAILREQIVDISTKLYRDSTTIDFDDENCDWMVIENYRLPPIWKTIATHSPLLLIFPTEYPDLPPVGFYLQANLPGAPDGHLMSQAYHDAPKEPISRGWKWYCVYINPGTWCPCRSSRPGGWRTGDNLWDYLTMINEALGSPTN